ncbi:hypothetical protein KZ810_13190 [Sphingomonas sp. RHCKR47]|uniref:hypothetical protein n=1 Tax=Sphingomonas citricola TaxID=2862498 RepID=UPI001CA48911|nr:hypothetical protein [Sphingomonas citricola]MBW6524457.1 hypothetical protein [Sphingomonas citricola]
MSAEIILVAGLGRCGTSLALQMLHAGGIACVGTTPSYEDATIDGFRRTDPQAWAACSAGKAVKLLDPHRSPPPLGPRYRTLWLFRDWRDQARSALKFIGASQDRASRKRMEHALKADTDKAVGALWRVGASPAQVIPFDCLLLRPRQTAELMARAIGREINVDRAASVVIDRSPRCYPGLLELGMMAA